MKELTPFPMKSDRDPGADPAEGLDATRLDDGRAKPGGDSVWRATLEVARGGANARLVPLGGTPVRVGRAATNDVVLSDDGVSRSHAEIRYENGTYVVYDLDSSNGTRVDDVRVKSSPLKSGARIGLGEAVLLFSQPAPDVAEADRLALMSRSDLLSTLEPPTRAAAARLMTVRFVPRGAVLLEKSATMEGILFIHQGRLRVVEVNDEGGERVVARIEAGDHFGERALVAAISAPQSLVADADSCVLELTKAALDGVLQKDPHQSQAMAGTVRLKLQTAQRKAAKPPALPTAQVAPSVRTDDFDNVVTSTNVEIVGEDKKILRAKERLEGFAKDDLPVLIVGLQGSGKRTFARHSHHVGPHKGQPYIEMSLADPGPGGPGAAIFGVEPQASGAAKGQIGYLEMIAEGTLAIAHGELLDAHLQALLASYLKLGWFHRLQGQGVVKARTRVILLATGEEAAVLEKLVPELRELVAKRTVAIPPLVQRLKDIPLLAEHYMRIHAAAAGRKAAPLSREATDKLVSYGWPGNVRELENVMQRAAIVTAEDSIIPGDLIFVAPPEKEIHKINVLRDDRVRSFLRHPSLMSTLIWADILFVIAVTIFTVYGGSRPAGHPMNEFATNPGMLVTWLIWFPALPISAFLIGRIWCGVCPIAGIGDLAGKVKRFNLPVPKVLKRLDFWMLAAMFILVDYFEELFGVADKPWATAMFLLIIIYGAVVMTVLFERKTFCKYVCPLAGVLGAYSSMSIFEVRGNKKVCQTQCGEHTCYKGSAHVEGCPLFAYPASMNTNADCMMCLNCLKSCENRGVQLNLRPPLQEIWRNTQPMLAMSVFGVILVGLMAKHQFPKLTSWVATQQRLGWSDGGAHTILFFGFALLVLTSFFLSSTLSAAASRESVSKNAAAYGVAFIPLAFSGHIAHLTHEFLSGGFYELLGYFVKVWDSVFKNVPIASSTVSIAPFISPSVITFIKFMMIAGGLVGSILSLVMIARRISTENVFARAMPHLLLVFAMWIGYMMIFTGATEEAAPAAPGGTPMAAAPANQPSPAALPLR